MNAIHKTEIRQQVIEKYNALQSMKAVGTTLGVSEATISLIINDKTDTITDKMWLKVGTALGWSKSGWQIVETTNTRLLTQTFMDAKQNSLWMAVSHQAGSGKTVSGRYFQKMNANKATYFIQAREWSRRQFLVELCRQLGITTGPGYSTTEDLLGKVVDYLLQRSQLRPLLIIDEADKLKADALRVLIPLYNELEDRVGVVIMGTENLQRTMNIGVQWNKKGFDELASRFGRRFINLYGATKKDVLAICEANGITSEAVKRSIWKEASPKQVKVNNQFVKMASDLRRIKRAVQREIIKLNTHGN